MALSTDESENSSRNGSSKHEFLCSLQKNLLILLHSFANLGAFARNLSSCPIAQSSSSSRNSQAREKTQSRLAVALEMPRASAASSIDSPTK